MPSAVTSRPGPHAGPLLSVTTVRDVSAGEVVVEVIGEVDTFTASRLEECLHLRVGPSGVGVLVVDLSQVTFFGAAGVTVLARAHRRCRMRGADLVIRTGGQRTVLRPLRLTGLADVVAVDPALPTPASEPGRPELTPVSRLQASGGSPDRAAGHALPDEKGSTTG